MDLISHALISLDELKGYVVATGDQANVNLTSAINGATEIIESRLDRRLVSRGSITEYHSPEVSSTTIRLSERPTHTLTSIHESIDWPRVYTSATLLAASGTLQGYEYDAEEGVVRRISYGSEILWACGRRTIKVVHEAGYKGCIQGWTGTSDLPAIPWDWKKLALAVAASIHMEGERKGWGISSQQDATMNLVRFMGWIPPSLMEQIDAAKRIVFEKTWERVAA